MATDRSIEYSSVVSFNSCPIQLTMKVAMDDKDAMAESLLSKATRNPVNEQDKPPSGPLPTLKYLPDDNEGWVTFDEPILYVYAGQGPYVGRDYMAFPVSKPDDGLIDVAVMTATSRADMLSAIDGAEKGVGFWHPAVCVLPFFSRVSRMLMHIYQMRYYKAHAYRVKPLSPIGNLSVDGERYPFEEFQVEVHPRLGTFLSCHGHYLVDFESRAAAQKE